MSNTAPRTLHRLAVLTGPLLLLGACVRRPVMTAPLPAPAAPTPAGAAPESDLVRADIAYLRDRHLLVPVAGADILRVNDSFDDARDGGRLHHAIDILAPRGTPVLAADDGRVLRLSRNKLGGITVYATDANARVVYYYAHLDHYHDLLVTGMPLLRGDTLGYVGTTGNAPRNTPHLHFQITTMPADGKYWNGEPIDPWPILRDEGRGTRDAGVAATGSPDAPRAP